MWLRSFCFWWFMFCLWSCSSFGVVFCICCLALSLTTDLPAVMLCQKLERVSLSHCRAATHCIFSDRFFYPIISEISRFCWTKPGAVQVESAKQVFVEKAQIFSCAQMFLLCPAGQRTRRSSAGISHELFFSSPGFRRLFTAAFIVPLRTLCSFFCIYEIRLVNITDCTLISIVFDCCF